MAKVNYPQRIKEFSSMMGAECVLCRASTRQYHASKLEVPVEKLMIDPNASKDDYNGAYRILAFFGVAYGQGCGTMTGSSPKDRKFQKAVWDACVKHNRNAHPEHIAKMIKRGYIKK